MKFSQNIGCLSERWNCIPCAERMYWKFFLGMVSGEIKIHFLYQMYIVVLGAIYHIVTVVYTFVLILNVCYVYFTNQFSSRLWRYGYCDFVLYETVMLVSVKRLRGELQIQNGKVFKQ